MTTEYYHDLSLPGGVAPSASEQATVKHFEHTLKMCVTGWQRGDHIVVLPVNIRDRYGDLVVQLLQRILTDQIGEPVEVTVSDDINGPKTYIQMPKLDMSQPPVEAQSVTSHQTETSDQPSAKADAAAIGTKKAPRPMNCWLMFRDAMHKTLKAQNPDFSVQQISTHCSKIWKNLTLDQKKPWKAAADAAKAEHQRLHPDYKYSPRKPGQKKKRQSRKAKQAAAAATDTTTLDFASVPAVSMTTTEINGTFANVADVDFGSFDNISANDAPELMDSMPFLSFGQHGNVLVPQVPDTESLRQDRLQVEMYADLGANSFYDMFSDEAFAFRSGADGNATLPSIYSDSY